jgi:hypothetical protein
MASALETMVGAFAWPIAALPGWIRRPARSAQSACWFVSLPENEAEHFCACPLSGRMVEVRWLGPVLHHEVPGHELLLQLQALLHLLPHDAALIT